CADAFSMRQMTQEDPVLCLQALSVCNPETRPSTAKRHVCGLAKHQHARSAEAMVRHHQTACSQACARPSDSTSTTPSLAHLHDNARQGLLRGIQVDSVRAFLHIPKAPQMTFSLE